MEAYIISIINTLGNFNQQTNIPNAVKIAIAQVVSSVQNGEYTNETRQNVFNLVNILADHPVFDTTFIEVFNELIGSIIDEENRQETDITDLLGALNNLNIS